MSVNVVHDKATSVRWGILALLTSFSFIGYVLRMNISVAAKFMIVEFGLNNVQMGQVFSSFMIGYALFQILSGALSDRLGPRFIFTVASLCWGITTILTGVIPGVAVETATGTFIALVVIRFLLGAAESPTYPVAARSIANWIPTNKRAYAFAFLVAGLFAGSAVTPPMISWLMVHLGWRMAFYITSALAFIVAIIWRWYATDTPAQHSGVNEAELQLINFGRSSSSTAPVLSDFLNVFRKADVWLLTVSFFFQGYIHYLFVFWFYIYLVDVKGFSILKGGVFASLPFIVSAISSIVGGYLCDLFAERLGKNLGRKLMVIGSYIISAALLFTGAKVDGPYLALIILSLSLGFLKLPGGAFWASIIDAGEKNAGAASGLMSTSSNIGGAVSTVLVPFIATSFGWAVAISSSSLLIIVGGLLWLLLRLD